MELKFKRHPANPLLQPNPLNPWESMNVFNCSVIRHNNLFHMLYRAQGLDYVSRIGYAVSEDGIHWNRLNQPVYAPHDGLCDRRGVEDPRVVQLDGIFYMTYTAYGELQLGDNNYYPMIARSENLITWEDVGPLEYGENKDHVLFSEKVGGRYAILHRRPKHIWLGYSEDFKTWTDHQIIMSPRPDNGWDETSIGSNGPPIKTEYGWLLFYHGYDEEHVYRQSVALLDLEDPTEVINRPAGFTMEPEYTWELKGDVPNVIFSCAALVVGDDVWMYYGGADRLIGLVTAPLADVIEFARFG